MVYAGLSSWCARLFDVGFTIMPLDTWQQVQRKAYNLVGAPHDDQMAPHPLFPFPRIQRANKQSDAMIFL